MPQFSEDRQPDRRRGKSFKNLLFDVIREESLLDVKRGATREEAEKAFINHAAQRAFNPNDQSSATVLNEFMKRSFPALKQVAEPVKFDLPLESTPKQKADAIWHAVSIGNMSTDIAKDLISMIKDQVSIEEFTELKLRLEEIEKAMGVHNA